MMSELCYSNIHPSCAAFPGHEGSSFKPRRPSPGLPPAAYPREHQGNGGIISPAHPGFALDPPPGRTLLVNMCASPSPTSHPQQSPPFKECKIHSNETQKPNTQAGTEKQAETTTDGVMVHTVTTP